MVAKSGIKLQDNLRLIFQHCLVDLEPLPGAGREVTNLNCQAQRIGEFLQLPSPQAHPVTIAAAAVGDADRSLRPFPPPAPNALKALQSQFKAAIMPLACTAVHFVDTLPFSQLFPLPGE